MQKILKISAIFGVIGGFLFILFFYLSSLFSENPFDVNIKSLDFFIYLFCIVVMLVWIRFKVQPKKFTFWQGFWCSFLTTFLMASLGGFFIFYFSAYISPQTYQKHIQNELKIIQKVKNDIEKKTKLNDKDKDKIKELSTIYKDLQKTSASDMGWYEWRLKIVMGLFFGLIVSLVLKKQTLREQKIQTF
jgi:hypothetical protein